MPLILSCLEPLPFHRRILTLPVSTDQPTVYGVLYLLSVLSSTEMKNNDVLMVVVVNGSCAVVAAAHLCAQLHLLDWL